MREPANHPKSHHLTRILMVFLALLGLAVTTACIYPYGPGRGRGGGGDWGHRGGWGHGRGE